jgi:hypothetical protein
VNGIDERRGVQVDYERDRKAAWVEYNEALAALDRARDAAIDKAADLRNVRLAALEARPQEGCE